MNVHCQIIYKEFKFHSKNSLSNLFASFKSTTETVLPPSQRHVAPTSRLQKCEVMTGLHSAQTLAAARPCDFNTGLHHDNL